MGPGSSLVYGAGAIVPNTQSRVARNLPTSAALHGRVRGRRVSRINIDVQYMGIKTDWGELHRAEMMCRASGMRPAHREHPPPCSCPRPKQHMKQEMERKQGHQARCMHDTWKREEEARKGLSMQQTLTAGKTHTRVHPLPRHHAWQRRSRYARAVIGRSSRNRPIVDRRTEGPFGTAMNEVAIREVDPFVAMLGMMLA